MISQILKVLVVDDHDEIRAQIAEYIRNENGFEVVGEAANGEEAVRFVELLEPDVVFMDMRMPVMGGVEAVRRIKTEHPRVRVVFVTIHDTELYRSLAEIIHVEGFVCKNSLIPDLRAALNRLR